MTVDSVILNARTSVVKLKSALKHGHISTTETRGSRSIRMVAEVGLLTRNIVIQGGDADSAADASSPALQGSNAGRVTGFASLQEQDFGCSIVIDRVLFHVPMTKESHRLRSGQVSALLHRY